MGKRSNFDRIERDCYDTPPEAVAPLIPYLPDSFEYIEPCAGSGKLIDAIYQMTGGKGWCMFASDIVPRADFVDKRDALTVENFFTEYFITNPPWSRDILHQMIEHFSRMRPTWLLFDADWMHTKQSAPYMKWCRKIVSVGRVKWIPDSKMTGKDNCAWYLFDQNSKGKTEFVGRAE